MDEIVYLGIQLTKKGCYIINNIYFQIFKSQ